MGEVKVVDVMIKDGLWDVFNEYHMGITAENVAEQVESTREEQDEFAPESQQKAEAAIKAGRFKDEIVPVGYRRKRATPGFDTDEFPRFGTTVEALAALKPAFKKDGTVTAGQRLGHQRRRGGRRGDDGREGKGAGANRWHGSSPTPRPGSIRRFMGIGPIPATRKALEKAGLRSPTST